MARTGFAVIGLGQFGRQLAITLSRAGAHVLAVDADPARIDEIKDLVARAVRANCTDERALKAARVQDVDCAVVALGEDGFEASTLAVSHLAALKVPRIIARSSTELRGKILQLVGATSVVLPETQAAEQLAHALMSPGLQASFAMPSGYTLAHVLAPPPFVGQTLAGAALRQKLKVTVVAIRRTEERNGKALERTLEAEPDLVIEDGDLLVVVGLTENVDALGRQVASA